MTTGLCHTCKKDLPLPQFRINRKTKEYNKSCCSCLNYAKQKTQCIHMKSKYNCKSCCKMYYCKDCDYYGAKTGLTAHLKKKENNKGKCGNYFTPGKRRIKETLDDMEIKYEYRSKYKSPDAVNNLPLLWDFLIRYKDQVLFIEFNSLFHFERFRLENGDEISDIQWEKIQESDATKLAYCKTHNYKFLVIPYTKYGQIEQMVSEFMIKHTDIGYSL